jgi:hypothetical protein
VTVTVTTTTYGSEATWRIDETITGIVFDETITGNVFGPYGDNDVFPETLCLAEGEHHLNYFDSYGDGWDGGTIAIEGYLDAVAVAGTGGRSVFVVGSGQAGSSMPPALALCGLHGSCLNDGVLHR